MLVSLWKTLLITSQLSYYQLITKKSRSKRTAFILSNCKLSTNNPQLSTSYYFHLILQPILGL